MWRQEDQQCNRHKAEEKVRYLQSFSKSSEEAQWKEAGHHRLRAGFEHGEPMLRPVTKYIAELRKEGEGGKATLAMKVAGAGLMTPERCNSFWPDYEHPCKCGHWLPDEARLFWQCRCLKNDRRPEIADNNWMTDKALVELGLKDGPGRWKENN